MSEQQFETAVTLIFSDENHVEDIFFTTDFEVTVVAFVSFDNDDGNLSVIVNAYNEDDESEYVVIDLNGEPECLNKKIVDVELQYSFELEDEENEDDEELEEA